MERAQLEDEFGQNYSKLRQFNKDISKAVRRDVRGYNADMIARTIESNRSLKVLRRNISIGRRNICKLVDKQGTVRMSRNEILRIVEIFYSELYEKRNGDVRSVLIMRVLNQGSEDIPDVSSDEMRQTLSEIKNNKSLGEDEIVIESIKQGGDELLNKLKSLFNQCLKEGITPSRWNNAVFYTLYFYTRRVI